MVTFVDDQGNHYQGEAVKGSIKDGKGEIKYAADGSYYRGDFANNMRDGRGELLMSNGDRYIGEWQGDMKSGYGKQEFIANGVVYYG